MEELRKIHFSVSLAIMANILLNLGGESFASDFVIGTSTGLFYVLVPVFILLIFLRLLYHFV